VADYLTIFGLSPLARGTLNPGAAVEHPERFIPAGAGNSLNLLNAATDKTVYPRWRGELRYPVSWGWWTSGLSPLARGTLRLLFLRLQDNRFIPAGAGNSAGRCLC